MNSSIIQLLVLAAIAVFLILRLRNVLGTREGFEKPVSRAEPASRPANRDFEVIEGGPDRDIIDHVPEGSAAADALTQMKKADPSFVVGEFLQGARGAYEMILMGFEAGDMEGIRPYISEEIFESFNDVVKMREEQGLKIDAKFIGIRELSLTDATYDEASADAEVSVRFVGEMTSVVKDAEGNIVEGDEKTVKRQRDVWTFSRVMNSGDPNWQLVATGE
ncbi:MAG: Tim44/TimA family putative adaptor protein [Paracoccaceae bacterium]|jgi:predicted lipid-binding transport protein (Tim44 family)|nr:Tim44/TimA family putative adaptor protein [Paracoccaceae bacterium]MDP7186141.1 Tim44/TimA family putative adaptor protein [Paracoccaceae bacterium]